MTDSIFRQIETWAVGKINTAITALGVADRPRQVEEFDTDIPSLLAQGYIIQYPYVSVFHLPTYDIVTSDDIRGIECLVRDHLIVSIISGNMKRPRDRRNQAFLIAEIIIGALKGQKHTTLWGGGPLLYPTMTGLDTEIRPKEWAYVIELNFSYTEIV